FALVTDNSMPAADAVSRGNSGALTGALLEDLTRLTSRHQMQVVAAEPGATVQEQSSVQVRAHLKMNATYAEFLGFLDDLTRDGTLIAVDRFAMVSSGPGRHPLDLWVTRYILKQQTGGHR